MKSMKKTCPYIRADTKKRKSMAESNVEKNIKFL